MQNIVEVACSSPPIAMNATKPAVQTAQAADQDPFDLVLQKASERVDNNDQYDRASRDVDSKPMNSSRGSESTNNQNISNDNKEGAAKTSSKTDKDDSNFVDEEGLPGEDTDPNTLALGYVVPVAQNMDQVVVEDTASEINPVETIIENVVVNNDNLSSQAEISESTQPVLTTSSDKEETIEEESQASPLFNEILNKDVKESKIAKDENSKSVEIEPNDVNQVGTSKDGSEIKLNNDSNITFAKNLEDSSISTQKVPTETDQSDIEEIETSPPDTPDGTASVSTTTSTVQTNQINEPARLAEAPRNEVITQVAQQLEQMVKTNQSSLRVQLYPENLGHIDLKIVTTKDGISVTMVTDMASTQQVLKSDIDSLKLSMEQAGIQLSNLNINQGQNSNKQQSFDHRQNFSNGSYIGDSSESSGSVENEQRVYLTSSVVDYRI